MGRTDGPPAPACRMLERTAHSVQPTALTATVQSPQPQPTTLTSQVDAVRPSSSPAFDAVLYLLQC